ncbi:hypothetical protein [Adhaeribacter aquaticus]|uniref:hypothetical protein n=1 Tax=Adhaeribacter aquaticus TaxID=299567 RepID=UPI000402C837|nr:hypothetical protein [Adhaeribacter aquaticus]
MELTEEKTYETAITSIRESLAMKRGYASRIKKKLPYVNLNQIYAVAWGKKKDPVILQALVDEATSHQKDPNQEIITNYLKNVA